MCATVRLDYKRRLGVREDAAVDRSKSSVAKRELIVYIDRRQIYCQCNYIPFRTQKGCLESFAYRAIYSL